MIFNDLIALVPDSHTPITEAQKAFFSADTLPQDKKLFLEFLLGEKRYVQIAQLMLGGRIVRDHSSTEFVNMPASEERNFQSRYFDLFLEIAKEHSIGIEQLMPMLLYAPSAPAGSLLKEWSGAIEMYLYKIALKNFSFIEQAILQNDESFRYINILLQIDRKRTVENLIDLALKGGTSFQKISLKRTLMSFKNEVVYEIRTCYFTYSTNERKEAVKLLQLFKNDTSVLELLGQIDSQESEFSVRKTLEDDALAAAPVKRRSVGDLNFFFDAMIDGTAIEKNEFLNLIKDAYSGEIASELIFSVYHGATLTDMVIVDDGKVLDLNNAPFVIPEDASIRVMHPVELVGKFNYLKQLNIAQPFDQIKRPVYFAGEQDKAHNTCARLFGTICAAPQLKNNIKQYGFKVLNKDADHYCSQVGIEKDGIFCVLSFTPVDLTNPVNKLITAEEVRFYRYSDTVKLNGMIYVDNVAAYPIAKLDARLFSEFMTLLYELLECK